MLLAMMLDPSDSRPARTPFASRSPRAALPSPASLVAVLVSMFASPFATRLEAQRRRADDDDPKPIIAAMTDAINAKPATASSVLSTYDRYEGRRQFDDEDRYAMHTKLVQTIAALEDSEVPALIRRWMKKSARSNLPSIVVMMKVLVHGKHSMSRADRIEALLDRGKGKSPQLALWALRLLGDSRWSEGVDALIALMRHEEDRAQTGSVLWHQASAELYRVLGAGAALGTAASIQKKWDEMGKKLPDEPDYSLDREVGAGRGATVVFFGDKISPRSVFCIDTSTSMRQSARIRTAGGKRTRGAGERDSSDSEPKIDIVKRELEKALGGLLPGFKFNVLSYNATFFPWRWSGDGIQLVDASSSTLESAKEFARGLPTEPGTNIHDTVAAALEIPDVDTIYLLSDGQPSRGGTPLQIEKTVRHKNYLRGVRIVTYGIVPERGEGSFDEDFMKKLAATNWGWYRRLND